jgi:hypothetical protein
MRREHILRRPIAGDDEACELEEVARQLAVDAQRVAEMMRALGDFRMMHPNEKRPAGRAIARRADLFPDSLFFRRELLEFERRQTRHRSPPSLRGRAVSPRRPLGR